MLKDKIIGFIGGGQMCEAIFKGALESGELPPGNIRITDISAARLDYLRETYAVGAALNDGANAGAKQLMAECGVIVLAVKPQYARPVLEAISGGCRPGQVIISIMGGITLKFLEDYFPNNPVFRVMPNTPMLVRKGIAGVAAGAQCSEADSALCKALFDLVGITYFLPETLIDPLTSVSGCSPAFAYLFIEAMADGGVEKGLPRDMAIRLAAQALSGAAEMVLKTGSHPAQLKDSVTSPGGGTIAGVHALEDGGFRAAVMNAVVKSCDRMIEVGKKA